MSKPLETLKYMRAFRCIGPDCEDHCCGGWRINLDEPDYRRLKDHRDKSPLVRAHFRDAVQRDTKDKQAKIYAHLTFNKEGGCYFEEGGLCAIHRDLGEHALPKTCATYPRKTIELEEHRELSGFLSCPEVARLCLLREDAMEHVVVDDGLLPSRIDQLDYRVPKHDLYGKYLERLRRTVLLLLSDRGRSPEANIYLVIYLARKIEPFFHQGVTKDPGQRLEKVLARMEDAGFQENILSHLNGEGEALGAAEFLLLVLQARDNHANRARYKHFVDGVLNSYGFADIQQRRVEALWQAYQQRQQHVRDKFGGRMNLYLHNYSLNLWHQENLGSCSRLSEPARRFVLGFAVVKFLLCGHPDLPEVLLEQDARRAREGLDRIAVEAVQVFSKNISHNREMLNYLAESMHARGMVDMASLAVLLR